MGGKQPGFSDDEQTTAKKLTWREKFLAEMEMVVPWVARLALMGPHDPKSKKKGGGPPFPLPTMLRIHLLRQGTIIDATLIAAPSSTKTKAGRRDPDMHQTKKGNQCCHRFAEGFAYGMKVHLGVAMVSGLIRSIVTTVANGHDLTPAGDLLHGMTMNRCKVNGHAALTNLFLARQHLLVLP